ncbi:MAG: hypothetical protein V4553_00490 [Bacteroidota bacterium]
MTGPFDFLLRIAISDMGKCKSLVMTKLSSSRMLAGCKAFS